MEIVSVAVLGSFLSQLDAGSLIEFRLLQGVSGGLIAPMTQLMLARVAGKHLVRVVGYAAVPVLLEPILGPVIRSLWQAERLFDLGIGAALSA